MEDGQVYGMIQIMKEILPDLENDIIQLILAENEYDLEKSINAGLTYQRIEEIEANANKNERANSSNQYNQTISASSNHSSGLLYSSPFLHNSYRGTRTQLPPDFLIPPRCRLTKYQKHLDRVEFTILFRRKEEKIGLNIDISDGLIIVQQITQREKEGHETLAEAAGIKEKDIILGVNEYYFSPYVDKDDILLILNFSKPVINIDFLRIPDRKDLKDDFFHPYVSFLLQEKNINADQAFLVTIALNALKKKAISWKAMNIPQIFRSYMDYSLKVAGKFTRRQSKVFDFTVISDFDKTIEIIRPAVLARILRFEKGPPGLQIMIVIWVKDVQSGVEWVSKRQYSDLIELHKHACLARPTFESVDFPVKPYRSSELMEQSNTLIPTMQAFLMQLIKTTTYHTLLPSILKIQSMLVQFLEFPKHFQALTTKKIVGEDMVRVFIHNILLLNSLESTIRNFVENYLSNVVEDLEEEWTIPKAETVLSELQTFIVQLHNFLLKFFLNDCIEIFRRFGPDSSRQSNLQILTESEQRTEDEEEITYKENEYDIISHNIRKQVEADVYMKCIDRVKFIVNRALVKSAAVYEEKVSIAAELPLKFFDIEEDFLTKESWWSVIDKFKQFREPSLPSEKIDTLVSAFKYLCTLYHHEHSARDVSALGADEMVPCFIYVFAKASIPDLVHLNFELQLISDPNSSFSEQGYCLATLEAAISHLIEIDPTKPVFQGTPR